MRFGKREFWMASLILFLAAGCGRKADIQKPVDRIRSEAQTLSLSDLEASARIYAEEIEKRKLKADEIRSRFKNLSPRQMIGREGLAMKDEIEKLTGPIPQLVERYEIYASKYRDLGGDMTKIKVDRESDEI